MTDIVERLRYAADSRPGGICEEAADEIERLRAEVERPRADAERYRWLRDNGTVSTTIRLSGDHDPRIDIGMRPLGLDAAIDAARAALAPGNVK